MSQDKDLSLLAPVTVDQGKCQWVKCTITGIDDKQKDRTHTAAVPYQMPGTTIFVHGVNSDGEWYYDASGEFAKGLNKRLGRDDLKRLEKDTKGDKDKVTAHRYLKNQDGERINSPIIPFWWGYKVEEGKRKLVRGTDRQGSTPAHTDEHGNPLRTDGAWGGGPFQNGGASLTSFWLPTGFRQIVAGGFVDVDFINPIVGRRLCDCPPRLYYAHAARRLAYLIQDIRRNLPNEPINIVSHSQGTIVALCALFFLEEGVRGPDTVILNSSPYRFEVKLTDDASASDGADTVQPEWARIQTFANAARIVAEATQGYPAAPAAKAACAVDHKPRHVYNDGLYAQRPPDAARWQAEIGGKVEDPEGPRGQDGKPWWSDPKFARSDTRGKLMVNFNPGDRVIGVSAVAGMGWRGIPTKYLGQVGGNVQQRMFARGTNPEHNPPVGSKTGYVQQYFYRETSATQGGGDEGALRHMSGSAPNQQWKLPSERMIFRVVPALGSLSPGESVTINAPVVPRPVTLPDNFDGGYMMYDGKEGKAPDGTAVQANAEQREDFEDDVTYQERKTVMGRDEKRMPTQTRYETWEEVELRRANEVGRVPIAPTNHAAILRYVNKDNTSPVADVLSYDLTVGQGYAWHDEKYWSYLLDLADWKKSDPYYNTGRLPDSDKTMPPGVVSGKAPASAADARPQGAPAMREGGSC